MKLKYKKMIIIATIVAMALGFVALIFLDNDRPSDSAQDASLNLNLVTAPERQNLVIQKSECREKRK